MIIKKEGIDPSFYVCYEVFYTDCAAAMLPAAISPVFLIRIGIKMNYAALTGSIAM